SQVARTMLLGARHRSVGPRPEPLWLALELLRPTTELTIDLARRNGPPRIWGRSIGSSAGTRVLTTGRVPVQVRGRTSSLMPTRDARGRSNRHAHTDRYQHNI